MVPAHPAHYAENRNSAGTDGSARPYFPRTRGRTKGDAMTDMLDDVMMGWWFLAAVTLFTVVHG